MSRKRVRFAVRSMRLISISEFIDRIRSFTNAAYRARGGARQMTLDEWRDVELEVKQRLENEA